MKLLIQFTSICVLFFFTSCGSSKTNKYVSNHSSKGSKINTIVATAKSYVGTRYRRGGTTKKGMDCSGLVYTSFLNNGVQLYRTSYDMAKQGKPIKTNAVQKGDLLFFKTSKSGRSINHVGVVSRVNNGEVYFIHSTTSKGVIESNLNTKYWNKTYKYAKRVL